MGKDPRTAIEAAEEGRIRSAVEETRRTMQHDEALRRILRAAQYVVEENDWVDEHGVSQAPDGVRTLADAMEELPLALRQRYGLHA